MYILTQQKLFLKVTRACINAKTWGFQKVEDTDMRHPERHTRNTYVPISITSFINCRCYLLIPAERKKPQTYIFPFILTRKYLCWGQSLGPEQTVVNEELLKTGHRFLKGPLVVQTCSQGWLRLSQRPTQLPEFKPQTHIA